MKEKCASVTIKQQVIDDFNENLNKAKEIGLNYFPSGLLKYYLYDRGFLTYEGRIIGNYCKENNIQIVRCSELGVTGWSGEKLHGNQKLFLFNK